MCVCLGHYAAYGRESLHHTIAAATAGQNARVCVPGPLAGSAFGCVGLFLTRACVTRCNAAVSSTSGTCVTHAVQLHTAAAAQLLLPGLQQQVWLFVRLFLQVRCTAAAIDHGFRFRGH